ncbi:winged helix-turn-helix transcriptional regulator [Streptomyces termitum]|uniref:ArsR family transcriptional regulator n=1 Tax=Streptomyces termitum TaxID=67368 RepID=A0A918W6B3_9ACTN|nr:helix-turn-helix domain-containing protein [Streptomyces termitum]GHA70560.1 ArsR family transcriptional regulator [Streptomyces termitum]
MALGKDYAHQQCSIARSLEVVGERWTLLVVRDAFYGVRRYGDFLAHLGAPRAVLAARLQALVDAGVLDRRRYQESPPRDEYVLTEAGLALWPVLRALGAWGRDRIPGTLPMRRFHHAACGTELGPGGECPSAGCPSHGRAVPPADIEMRPGAGLDPDPADPVSRALLRPRRLLVPLEHEPPAGNSPAAPVVVPDGH